MPTIISIKILHQSAITVLLISLLASSALAANLISNGTFDSPNIGGVGSVSYAAGSTAITGWTVDTTPADGVQIGGAGVLVPGNGSQNLQLTGGPGNNYHVGGGIHQIIATTSNQVYNLSIDVASRQNNFVTGNFSFGGQNQALTASTTTFTTLTWSVTATNTNPVIDITGSSSSSSAQLIIDNVSVTAPAGPVNGGTSTVAAAPNSIPADGSTTSTITVSLQDASGNPVAGKTVTLASNRGAVDTISAASGASSASGLVTFTVRSTATGTAVFSATDATDSLALTSTAAVFVYAVGSKGPQASPVPIVFDQTATNDNLVVLMAAASEYSSDLTLYQDGPSVYPKHFWINNWSNGTNDYFKWNVALATGAVYHVYAKLSAGAAVPVQLSLTGTNTVLNFTTRPIGWDKLDCGTISLPAGTSQLVLRKNTTDTSQVISIKSLELIRQSDLPAYQQRVASFRADTTWMSQAKYGLMTQFGAWGYPPTGPQPSLQNMANSFSVSNFVNLVTNTGCKYVIFSLTWYTYQMLAPIQAVTNIVPGNSNLTSTRDVIGELATALHAVGVRFTLYYHCGSDSQSPGGYDSTPWWQAQQFPEPGYTERGVGDRSVFLTNWCNVISEIGNRYGTNLDGWFIDDGLVYYPAPFEHLGQAARAGNPNRLICYNPWIATEYTDFQDVFMGENSQGQSQFGSAPNGGNGIFTDGPQVGLLQHGMFTMEQDWGIHQANQPITTQITASQAIGWVQSASALGVPLSFNMMLWSDMTYSTSSLNVLLNLKSAIYGGSSASLSSNNIVMNGTFESPVTSGATLLAAGSTALTGWTVDNTPSDGIQFGPAGTFGPNNGSQNLQLTGGSTYAAGGGISQTIATIPGATYTIIIDVASRQGNAITGNFNFGGSNYVLNASSAFFTTLTWKAVATGSNTLINITGYANTASGQLLIDNVSVTLFSDPNITTQPGSQTTTIGSTAVFRVTAGGTAPFTYQWQANGGTGFTNLINGGQISGVNTNVLTISSATTNWALTYQVIVTNNYGAITSSPATLTLVPYALFVTNSIGISNYSFENPSGLADGSYETTSLPGWGTSISGSAVYAVINPGTTGTSEPWPSNTPPGLDGTNFCQIFAYGTGGSGIVYLDTGVKYQAGVNYTLTAAFGLQTNSTFGTNSMMALYNSSLNPIASVVINPANLIAGAFTNQNLAYTGTGTEVAGSGVDGTAGDILVGFAMPASTASDPNGQTYFDFDNVRLTAGYPTYPVITSQPASQANGLGSTVSFNVSASGPSPLSYQWQASGGNGFTNVTSGGIISGATSNTLTLAGITTNWALSYRVIVTNGYGSVTSSPASLTVLPGTIVPIVNPNFDVDTITGGNAPAYQIVTPTGWTAIGINANNLIGLISPANSTSYPATVTGSSSPNAFFSFSADGNANPGVSQTLTTLLNSNTTYTLSVQVGNRTNGVWGGYHILLETTNGTVVGDWVGVYTSVAAPGTFATTAKSYTTGPNPPGLGQPLVIVLEQAVPAAGASSDFDNVSLLATPAAPRAQGATIDVYVCSGQSNCHGWYANVAALSQGNQHYANAPDARVLYAYQCALVGAASYSTGSMGQLSPEGAGHVSNFTGFGPELSAGSDLAARFGRPLAVIKFASGGANLDTQFRKAANYLYPLMIAKITNSLQQLTAEGFTPTLKGFFWLQGETDAGANPATYTNDIAQFVSDLRHDLQVTNLEFVLTEINSNMPNFAAQQTGVAQVNGGMLALVNSDPNVKYVTTHDITSGFADNAVHYTADQTVTIGQRWAATYTDTTPPPGTNASLTSLVVSPALSFTPTFSSNGLSYAATEAYGAIPSVTVTNADLTATDQLIYNGATNVIASGAASTPLVLNANPAVMNVVRVRVTAPDGVTVQTYTVNVTQLPNQSAQPSLTNSVSNGMLNLAWGLDHLGYRLLMQTNNLNQGISGDPNDWATVPGSTATNALAIPIMTTNLDEYYRLVYP